MAALTVQTLVDSGSAITFVAASVSDTADVGNGRNTFLVYKNTNAAARIMNVVVPGNTSYGQALPDVPVTVPLTNGERWIPLRKEYADQDTNRATITVADASGVTVAVVRI